MKFKIKWIEPKLGDGIIEAEDIYQARGRMRRNWGDSVSFRLEEIKKNDRKRA